MDNSTPETVVILYERTEIPRVVKRYVWETTQGHCWYCGVRINPFANLTIDHMLPLSRGGENEIENLAPCCTTCNGNKKAQTPEEWRPFFAEHIGSITGGKGFWFESRATSTYTYPAPADYEPVFTRQEWRQKVIAYYRTRNPR